MVHTKGKLLNSFRETGSWEKATFNNRAGKVIYYLHLIFPVQSSGRQKQASVLLSRMENMLLSRRFRSSLG
jgi:hypothetical protein